MEEEIAACSPNGPPSVIKQSLLDSSLPSSSASATPSLEKTAAPRALMTPFWVHFMSGGLAGTIGATLTCPLEVVKTRFQSSHYKSALPDVPFLKHPMKAVGFHIRGTADAIKQVYRNEGLFALWKGVGATIVGVMPSRAIYFSCYNKGKVFLTEHNGGKESSLIHLGAAASAGILTATATNPIWLIKTRLQLQSSSAKLSGVYYKSSLHCLKTVVQKEGLFSLYQGLSASYLGAIEGTLQWVIYEKFKRLLKDYRSRHDKDLCLPDQRKGSKDWADYFMIAAASKLIACCLTYPHEVLRTRLRQGALPDGTFKYKSLAQATALIYREEGMAAFYGGMTAHLLRVVPNSAIMFFLYEVFVHAFSKCTVQ